MTQIRMDKVQFDSEIDTYINYDTLTDTVSISGSVDNGTQRTFAVNIPYTRANTRADVYSKNLTTGIKTLVPGMVRTPPYIFVSSEIAVQLIFFSNISGVDTLRYELIVINNTGSSINLVNQTIEVTAALIVVPV